MKYMSMAVDFRVTSKLTAISLCFNAIYDWETKIIKMLHPKIRGVACSRQRPALATVVGYLYPWMYTTSLSSLKLAASQRSLHSQPTKTMKDDVIPFWGSSESRMRDSTDSTYCITRRALTITTPPTVIMSQATQAAS